MRPLYSLGSYKTVKKTLKEFTYIDNNDYDSKEFRYI